MMNPESENYVCQYPQKGEPCPLPAFDWIELSQLYPPLRVRVCAAHWLEYARPHLPLYTLPLGLSPQASRVPSSDLCGQSIRQSVKKTSRQAAASELLHDFAEWRTWQDKCRKKLRGW